MRKLLCLFILLPLGILAQKKYSEVNLEVDFSGKSKTYQNYWNSTGFTPSSLMAREDMQQTLDYISALPNQGIKYIRIHFLLNLVGSRNMETSHPEFNFEKLDAAFDAMVSRGLKPIFEIMGFPKNEWVAAESSYDKDAQRQENDVRQWVPDFHKKQDYRKWHEFVKTLVTHLEKRYGVEELKSWYFECTNEANSKGFWKQDIPALLNYWDATSEAVKAVNPGYRVGGPDTSSQMCGEFKSFLRHCDNGDNVITGKKGAPLDFITVHCKERPYQMVNLENEHVKFIRDNTPRFKDLPFGNDEADPIVGWSRRFWWRADAWYGACIVSSIDAHNRLSADSLGINYALLSNDNGFMGDWYMRTHLAKFEDKGNEGRFWLFKQPSLTAMTFLALCTGERYEVKGYSSTRETTVVIPVKTLTGDIVLLVANKPEFGDLTGGNPSQVHISPKQSSTVDAQGTVVNIDLKNIGLKNFNYSRIQLDNMNGNSFTAWTALGQPDTISRDQYQMIAANMEPVIMESRKMNDLSSLKLIMSPSSVCLIVLSKDKGKPEQPKIWSVKEYAGYNGEKTNFVRWQQTAGQIVTYDLYASYDGAAFVKVNPSPLLDCGFLNLLPEGTNKVEYKVMARNLN